MKKRKKYINASLKKYICDRVLFFQFQLSKRFMSVYQVLCELDVEEMIIMLERKERRGSRKQKRWQT